MTKQPEYLLSRRPSTTEYLRKLTTAAAVSLALASGEAFGFELGAIELQSAINQPLSAEIALTSVKSDNLQDIRVTLASAEAFAQAGIERSSVLLDLRFSIDESSGSPVIKVEGTQPVAGPFLSLLLEVSRGQTNRVQEYTVLLDAPALMPLGAGDRNLADNQPAVAQRGEAALLVPPSINRSADDSGAFSAEALQVEVPDSADDVPDDFVLGEDSEQPPDARLDNSSVVVSLDDVENPSGNTLADTEVTVNAGDTLFEIARDKTAPGRSVQQMMMAILAANESSFINSNINLVKAGAILRVPNAADVQSLTQAQALSAVDQQNQLWQDYRDSLRATQITGNFRPVADDKPQLTDGLSEPVETVAVELDTLTNGLPNESKTIPEDERQELSSREELRIVVDNETSSSATSTTADETTEGDSAARVDDFNRRWQLAREELTAARLRENDLRDEASQLQDTLDNLDTMVSLRQNEVARLEELLADVRQAAEQNAQDSSIAVGKVTDSARVAGDEATGAANTAAEQPAESLAISAGEKATDAQADVVTLVDDTEDSGETRSWNSYFLDNPKQMAVAGIGGLGLLGVLGTMFLRRKQRQDQRNDIDRDMNMDVVINRDLNKNKEKDKDKTIAAANVYLNYGFHEQAEQLLIQATEHNPDNQRYASKLLQTYHAQGNVDAFNHTANDFHQRFGGASNPKWPAISAMGANFDPDNPLYSSTPLTSSRKGGVDSHGPVGTNEHVLVSIKIDGASCDSDDHTQSDNAPTMDYEGGSDLMDKSPIPAVTIDESDLKARDSLSKLTTQSSAVDGGSSIEIPGNNAANQAVDETLEDEFVLAIDGTMSAEELDTMLILAKAYIDMGDKDAAISALGVVVKGGSPKQIEDAKTLFGTIS